MTDESTISIRMPDGRVTKPVPMGAVLAAIEEVTGRKSQPKKENIPMNPQPTDAAAITNSPDHPPIPAPLGAITLSELDQGSLESEFQRCVRLVVENIENDGFRAADKRMITLTISLHQPDDGDLEITHSSAIKLPQPNNGPSRTSRAVTREWTRADGDTQTVLFPVE